MTIYLSARYDRIKEMRTLRHRLNAIPRVWVQSCWLDLDEKTLPGICAVTDRADIRSCDVLIAFTEEPGIWSTGGRHVEFGIAWEAGKRLWVVGPEENIFHSIAHEQFRDAEEMVRHLAALKEIP